MENFIFCAVLKLNYDNARKITIYSSLNLPVCQRKGSEPLFLIPQLVLKYVQCSNKFPQ